MITPIEFITQLRKSDSYIKDIYMNGGCYQFYKVLKLLYPNAVPFKVKVSTHDTQYNHIITLISNKYYDIKGEVDTNKFYDIKIVYENDITELEKWSFSRNNWLYKTCPNCEEPIMA